MASTPVPIEGANTVVGFNITVPFTTTDQFSFSFPYLDQSHFAIEVASETTLDSADYEFVSDYLIQLTQVGVDKLNALYTSGTVDLIIYRSTQLTTRFVDFQDGANLTEKDLDLNSNQAFYLIQEAMDTLVAGTLKFNPVTGSVDAEGKEIIDLGYATQNTSAANLNVVLDNVILPDYTEGGDYRDKRLVMHNAIIYRANKDVPSAPAVFDAADWDVVVSQADLSQIATNAANIATNVTDIGTNAANIATNVTNIGTNTTNIGTNTTNIGTNASNLTAHEALTNAHQHEDTEANLVTWAATATNGEHAYATDTKKYYGVEDGALAEFGGGGGSQVAVSVNDTTPAELDNKVDAGKGIVKSILNPAANEQLQLELGPHYLALASTGLFTGGTLSVGAATGTIDISAGSGLYVDSTTDFNNIVQQAVTIAGRTNLAITNIATQPVTYIMIDKDDNVIQNSTFPTASERRSNIFLGVAVHSDNVNVILVNNLPEVGLDATAQLHDVMQGLGFFNLQGNRIVPNGANLSFDKSSGSAFKEGANFTVNKNDPHTITLALQTAATFRYRNQDSSEGSDVTVVDPTTYDNAGVTTTVPSNNNATIQRVYIFPSGVIRVQRGQEVFSNFSEAVNSLGKEPFLIEPNIDENGLMLASIVLKKNATDLSDTSEALIFGASRFGELGSVGSSATTDLNQAYLNSVDPEIVLSNIIGALTINAGDIAAGDTLFEVEDSAGTTKHLDVSSARTSITDADGTFELDEEMNIRHKQSFKSMSPSSFFTVSDGVNLAVVDETVDPLRPYRSAKLTQTGSNLATDYYQTPSFSVDADEYRSSYNGFEFISRTLNALSGEYSYELFANDGSDRSLGMFDIEAGLSEQLARFNVEDADTTFFVRIYTTVPDATYTLTVDKFRINLEPDMVARDIQTQNITWDGNSDTLATTTGTIKFNGLSLGNSYPVEYDSGTGLFTALSKCTVKGSFGINVVSGANYVSLNKNGSHNASSDAVAAANDVANVPVNLELNSGETFSLTSLGILSATANGSVNLIATKSSLTKVIKSQTSELDTNSYSPSSQGLGTTTSENVTWSRTSGNKIKVWGYFTLGTRSATEIQIGLPSNYTIDSSFGNLTPSGSLYWGGGSVSPNYIALGTAGDSFINVGYSGDASGFDVAKSGTDLFSDSTVLGFEFEVPVNELSASDIVYQVPVGDQVENNYSAKIDVTGAVSDENTTWITSTSYAAGITTLNLADGIDGMTLKIAPTSSNQNVHALVIEANRTSTSVDVLTQVTSSLALGQFPFHVLAQRGSDYREPKALVANATLSNSTIHQYSGSAPTLTTADAYWTGRKKGGRKVMGFDMEVTTNVTSSITLFTLPTGLKYLGVSPNGVTVPIFFYQNSGGSSTSIVEYLPSTGVVRSAVSGSYQITSGDIITLEYLE